MVGEFQLNGRVLIDNGYAIVPIVPGEKRPAGSGWQNTRLLGPAFEEIKTRYTGGVGILCGVEHERLGHTFAPIAAVDIDTTNAQLAEKFAQWCQGRFGVTVERIGLAPKTLLVYRAAEAGWSKRTSDWFEDGEGTRHRLEVLGKGQQFVAYAVHPDTGEPYQWVDLFGGLTEVPASELPVLTQENLDEIVRTFDLMAKAGGLTVASNTPKNTPPGHRQTTVDDDIAALLDEPPVGYNDEQINELLTWCDPQDYDEWLKVGMALHHERPEDGLALWDTWSQTGDKYQGLDDLAHRWEGFGQGGQKPVTLRTLIIYAKNRSIKKVKDEAYRLVEHAKSDAGAVFEPEALAVLRNLQRNDNAEFVRFRQTLKKEAREVPLRELDKALTSGGKRAEGQDHLSVARVVQADYGSENIKHTPCGFFHWDDSGVWKEVDDLCVKQRVQATIESKYSDEFQVNSSTVNSITEVLKTEIHSGDLLYGLKAVDCINVKNGELYYRGGAWQLQPHNRDNYMTAQLQVAYDPKADAPRFCSFVREIFEGDADADKKAALLYEALGYTLMQKTDYERFFLLVGGGANGKSVLLDTLYELLGPKQVAAVQPSQFSSSFKRAHLRGKLANIVTELAEGAEIADRDLKAIVSGDIIDAEHKFGDSFEYKPFATCWFATNHMPYTRDFSEAFFRRATVLTFNRRFKGESCDPQLREKLRAELAGILNLALIGLARVMQQGGFTSAASDSDAKREWQIQTDPVSQFVEECCSWDINSREPSSVLYQRYTSWAYDAGIKSTLNRKNFTTRLLAHKADPVEGSEGRMFVPRVEAIKGTGGQRMLAGIRLKVETITDHLG